MPAIRHQGSGVAVDVRDGLPSFTILGSSSRVARLVRAQVGATLGVGVEIPARRVTVSVPRAWDVQTNEMFAPEQIRAITNAVYLAVACIPARESLDAIATLIVDRDATTTPAGHLLREIAAVLCAAGCDVDLPCERCGNALEGENTCIADAEPAVCFPCNGA